MDELAKARKLEAKIIRLSKYGLSLKDYEKIKWRQYNRCTICNRKFKKIRPARMDHCHKCNRFRSLLCSRCNTGLGLFLDDVALLARAIVYLQDHDCEYD